MTRHRESEASSSSLYNQNNPWEPTVGFESFIRNDESIENQVTRGGGCRGGGRGGAAGVLVLRAALMAATPLHRTWWPG